MSGETPAWTIGNIRDAVVGIGEEVPLLGGGRRPYVNLDNAATTPALRPIVDDVLATLQSYSSVHRGTGFKSQLSTSAYETSREVIARFVGADPERDVVIFARHATEALNLLARRLEFPAGSVILTSLLEHHANDLPWRAAARQAGVRVEHVTATPEGEYDLDDLRRRLDRNRGHVALVTVTAASNVSGYLPPVHLIARRAHEAGARVVVDCAQLAAHKSLDMKPHNDPEHLDFVAFSGHKMYAPFGAGVLVGPRSVFERGDPGLVGGGCVKVVSLDRVVWEDPPEREEAGSPNVIGAIALASACAFLKQIGLEEIAAHERRLLDRLLAGLRRIPKVVTYARPPRPDEERIGLLAFNIEGMDDFLVAAILSYEAGIGVRAGCFCAHPYMKFLLRVTPEVIAQFEEQVIRGSRANLPGAVRASFGMYNTEAEVDHLVEWVGTIARGDCGRGYGMDPRTGMYAPEGWPHDVRDRLPLRLRES